ISWSRDDVSSFEVSVEGHRGKTSRGSQANDLRLLARRTRTDDLVRLSLDAIAQVIGQLLEIARDVRRPVVMQQVETRLQAVNQRGGTSARFPSECAGVPALLEVLVVLRVGYADPADEGG